MNFKITIRSIFNTFNKHCGAAGKLWGNFGETLGATEYWVLGTGHWQTLAGND